MLKIYSSSIGFNFLLTGQFVKFHNILFNQSIFPFFFEKYLRNFNYEVLLAIDKSAQSTNLAVITKPEVTDTWKNTFAITCYIRQSNTMTFAKASHSPTTFYLYK